MHQHQKLRELTHVAHTSSEHPYWPLDIDVNTEDSNSKLQKVNQTQEGKMTYCLCAYAGYSHTLLSSFLSVLLALHACILTKSLLSLSSH